MTITFGLNSNNDLYLDASGNLAILTGIEAVEQCCETASKAQLGEMVLEIGLGLPNFQSIWVGTPNYSLWQSYLVTALNNVIGVNEVVSVSYQVADGILNYTATIASQYGSAEVTGTTTP
jgi:hypothetical protein